MGFGLCGSHYKPATMKDATGFPWCDECKKRCDLMNWGHRNNWTGVYVHPYAIAEGEWFWNSAIKVGRDEAIAVLHAYLIGGTDDVEVSA